MKPKNSEFLKCAARWHGEHKGVRYELSWHSYSEEYSPEGTWCWYLLLTDEAFYPEDWAKLRLEKKDTQFMGKGAWHRNWDYDSFPDFHPHGGWTFGEMETFLGRDGVEHEKVKVGCDYNHAFDRDGGYWEGKDDVERDVKASIDKLVETFPRRRERCGYSGRWDDSEQFYTAKNGRRIHVSQKTELDPRWEGWFPADAA